MDIDVVEKETEKEPCKMVSLELPESLRQKIRAEAFNREISFSAMVRLIIKMHYFAEEED